MLTSSSHMNSGSHSLNSWWDLPFMWEEGVRIYDTPGVPNNFSPDIETLGTKYVVYPKKNTIRWMDGTQHKQYEIWL